MLVPLLICIVFVAAAGGWVFGRLKTPRRVWLVAWVLLPVLVYLVVALITVDMTFWRQEVGWVSIGLGFVGLPMLVWMGAAAAGFFVGRLRDDSQT